MLDHYTYITYRFIKKGTEHWRVNNTCFMSVISEKELENNISQVVVYPNILPLWRFQYFCGNCFPSLTAEWWIKIINKIVGDTFFEDTTSKTGSKGMLELTYTPSKNVGLQEFKFHLFLLRTLFNTPYLSFLNNWEPTSTELSAKELWQRIIFLSALNATEKRKLEGVYDSVHTLLHHAHRANHHPLDFALKRLKNCSDVIVNDSLFIPPTSRHSFERNEEVYDDFANKRMAFFESLPRFKVFKKKGQTFNRKDVVTNFFQPQFELYKDKYCVKESAAVCAGQPILRETIPPVV